MTRRRRVTDRLPMSDVVTRGNLDDRLAIVDTRVNGLQRLAEERWDSHHESHDAVEKSLEAYKREANEWRATLGDLRLTFIPKAEFQSEHRALDAKLHGEIVALANLVNALDTRVDSNSSDIKTMAIDREARRSLFSDSRNTILLAIAVVGIALAILDRLLR